MISSFEQAEKYANAAEKPSVGFFDTLVSLIFIIFYKMTQIIILMNRKMFGFLLEDTAELSNKFSILSVVGE